MPLRPGTLLGAYEIQTALGAGGCRRARASRRERGRPRRRRGDEVVGDGHEELRLVGIEGERDDPGAERCAERPAARPLSSSSESPGAPR